MIFDSPDPTFIQIIAANLNTFGRAIEENQELRNKINMLAKIILGIRIRDTGGHSGHQARHKHQIRPFYRKVIYLLFN